MNEMDANLHELTDIDYLLSRPSFKPWQQFAPVSPVSVIERLNCIIGSEIRQTELMILRNGLFYGIMGRATRTEKRLKVSNAAAFEAHRPELMVLLERPGIMAAIRQIAIEHRSKAVEKEMVLMHAFHLA
jgi:hypothetical protein